MFEEIVMASKKEMKEEAIKRLKSIKGLNAAVIGELENHDCIMKSDSEGNLTRLNESEFKLIKQVEGDNRFYVYHMLEYVVDGYKLLCCMYIDAEKDSWDFDREDYYEFSIATCYVYNMTEPEFSEHGEIYFRQYNGGIIRTVRPRELIF